MEKTLIKCGLYALSLTLLFVQSFIVFSDVASAVSPYDSTVRYPDNLIIKNGTHEKDITTDWSSYLLNADNKSTACNEQFNDNFFSAVTNGEYAVMLDKATNTSTLKVYFTTAHTNLKAEFHTNAGVPTLYIPPDGVNPISYFEIRMQSNGQTNAFGCIEGTAVTPMLSNTITTGFNQYYLWLTNFDVVYPEGYEGLQVRDSWSPPEEQNVNPEYSYHVTADGNLNIKYLKNLKHFLTGISWIVVNETTDNWESSGTEIHNREVHPAGWADENMQLNSAGYYMIRIDHNQQLDEPPWPADDIKRNVCQVWIQIYWNGKSVIQGNTIGTECGGITNEFRDTARNKITTAIDKLTVDDYGLQALIYSPISFMSQLFNIEGTCTPININFLGNNSQIPCLRSLVNNSPLVPAVAILSTVINGLIMYWVSMRTFATIKNVSSPKDDKIEVMKL